jgi:two-component system response regulator AdeR
MSSRPTVLVVDDEVGITDLYAEWLSEDYEVRTAYNGQEALDQLGDGIGVVLLDRRMPDMSGDEVLAEIRDQGIDARVAMVTAVDPDFDILDMGFDTYVVKPTTEEELRETVETLLERAEYDERLQEYFSLSARRAALDANKGQAELESSEEYADLQNRLAELQASMDDTFEELDDEGFRAAFHAFSDADQ